MTGTVLTEKYNLLASLSSEEVTCTHAHQMGHVPLGMAFRVLSATVAQEDGEDSN